MARIPADPTLQKILESLKVDEHIYYPFSFTRVPLSKLTRQITNANANWNIQLRSIKSKTGIHIVRIK